MSNAFVKTYREVFKILPSEFRRKFAAVQLLILVTSIVDLLGLALFIPVLSAVSNQSILDTHPRFLQLKDILGVTDNEQFLLMLFVVALVFFMLRSLFIIYSQWVQSKFVFALGEYVSTKTYKHYLCLPYESFKKMDSAKVVRELTISPQHFAKFLVLPLLLLTSEFLILSMVVAGIFIYDSAVFLLIIFTVFPIAYLFNLLVKKKIRRYGEEQNIHTPILLENSMRGILGFIDVKLRGKEKRLVGDYTSTLKFLNSISVKTSVISIIPAKMFELTTMLGLFVIFCYGVYISSKPESVMPLIALYAAAAYRLIPSLSRVLPALLNLEQFQYLFGIYGKALASKSEFHEFSGDEVSFERSLQIDKMSFKFQNTDKLLFNDFSLSINKGEILGVIGRSGSGKTSLANIIAGFLVPETGSVLVDGIAINKENISAWMDKLSYVQQSPYLEKGSLASNIAFLDESIDHDRLNEAIKKSSLSDFVGNSRPEEIIIEEQGKNLSGGQRQRVIIARALYHNARLIILDEATAALDNETEEDINETVKNLRGQGITIVIIAHRISTLKYTDRIIRLEEGKLVEETQYGLVQTKD